MGIEKDILDLVLHVTVFGTLLCAVLLYLRRDSGDRSRKVLAWSLALCGVLLLLKIGGAVCNLLPLSSTVLPPTNLKGGLITILFFLLYPIEIIHPGWLNFKRVILLLCPWILLELFFAGISEFRPLTSFQEIVRYAGEFNVWARLLVLALFLPITFILFYIPHNWAKSSADNRWIWWYTCGSCGITVLYTLFMLTGSVVISSLHISYCLAFFLVVTYQELFLRLRVPTDVQDTPQTVPTASVVPETLPCSPELNSLWDALLRLMDEEKPWRNPDLTLEGIAERLDSNRTTLAQSIRQHGYEGYRHFINRRRIIEFLRIAETDPFVNIQDTFFRVGFRSKITALRYFREYTQTTPTEYLRKLPTMR